MQVNGKMALHHLWRHNRNQKARAAPFYWRSFIKRFRAKNSLKFQLFVDYFAIYKKQERQASPVFLFFIVPMDAHPCDGAALFDDLIPRDIAHADKMRQNDLCIITDTFFALLVRFKVPKLPIDRFK